jgi:hypothetical protein
MIIICELSCFHNLDGVCQKRGNLHIKRTEPTRTTVMGYCADYQEKLKASREGEAFRERVKQ